MNSLKYKQYKTCAAVTVGRIYSAGISTGNGIVRHYIQSRQLEVWSMVYTVEI